MAPRIIPPAPTTAQIASELSSTFVRNSVGGAPMAAGIYYSGVGVRGITKIPAEAEMFGQRIVPGRSCILSRLAVNVTIVGTSGAVIRLGVAAFNETTWVPGDVILDAGTVSGTSTGAAVKTGLSLPLTAGVPVLLLACVQGGAGTRPTINCCNFDIDPQIGLSDASTLLANQFGGWKATGITGAFPTSPTWTLASEVPRIAARADA